MDLTVVLPLQPPPKPGLGRKDPAFSGFFLRWPQHTCLPRKATLTTEGGFLSIPVEAYGISGQMSCHLHQGHPLPTSSDKGIASNSAFLELSYPCGKMLGLFLLEQDTQQMLEAGRLTWPEVLPTPPRLQRQSKRRSCGHPLVSHACSISPQTETVYLLS